MKIHSFRWENRQLSFDKAVEWTQHTGAYNSWDQTIYGRVLWKDGSPLPCTKMDHCFEPYLVSFQWWYAPHYCIYSTSISESYRLNWVHSESELFFSNAVWLLCNQKRFWRWSFESLGQKKSIKIVFVFCIKRNGLRIFEK